VVIFAVEEMEMKTTLTTEMNGKRWARRRGISEIGVIEK
jgi:hypothetical protein